MEEMITAPAGYTFLVDYPFDGLKAGQEVSKVPKWRQAMNFVALIKEDDKVVDTKPAKKEAVKPSASVAPQDLGDTTSNGATV